MEKNTCGNCGFQNKQERYFCKQCGSFLTADESIPESAYALPQMKMMRILENLQHVPHSKILWDDLIDQYMGLVERMRALFAVPGMGADKNAAVCEKMNDFAHLCCHADFQIAFVGTIKTGKSTLINALLGKNYASMAVTPETAALTKFRASDEDSIKVVFYTPEEWNRLWKSRSSAADAFNQEYEELKADEVRDKWVGHPPYERKLASDDVEEELSKWSSSQSPEHYFVKEIEVGISTLPKDFPHQVVFVDTPGLSDPVAYRSELTRQYIRKANAVFVCVDAQKIQKEEIETISSVFSFSSHNKDKVHIIATHWDALNNPEADWVQQKAYLEKKLTGKAFFDTVEMAQTNIMHSAAYIYNLCRDYHTLNEAERKPLRKFAVNYDDYKLPDDLDQIKEKTNIDIIASVIRDKLADNYRKLLMDDIQAMYKDILHRLERVANEKRKELCGLLETSSMDAEEMEKRIASQKERFDTVKQVSNQLTAIMERVKHDTQIRMDAICGKLRLSINPGYARRKKTRRKKKR